MPDPRPTPDTRRRAIIPRFRYRWRTGIVTIAIVGTVLTIGTIAWQVIRGWREQREAARLALKHHLMTATEMMFDNTMWGSLYIATAVTSPVYISKRQDQRRTPETPPFGTPSLSIADLQHLVDSAFIARRIGSDSARGYFRITVRDRKVVPGSFLTSGVMQHPEYQEVILRKIREDTSFTGPPVPVPLLMSERPHGSPALFAISSVWGRDSSELVFFGITFRRSAVFEYYGNMVYNNIALLPSHFNGVNWVTAERFVHDSLKAGVLDKPLKEVDEPELKRNNQVIAVRIFDTDIAVKPMILYETPNPPPNVWESPYVAEYEVPSWGLIIRTALPRDHAERLIAAAVPLEAEQRLLAGITLLGIAFIGAALVELRRQRQLVRTRADFVSSISHELRTPLAHVSTLSETLYLGRAESPEQEQRWLRAINREAQRLGTMVENVLLFARGEREHLRIIRRLANIGEIVHDVASIVEPYAASRSARICVDAPSTYDAWIDAGAVRQVLLNLLDNAIKYGPAAGQTITVTLAPRQTAVNGADLSQTAELVTITVDDQGSGIPPEERERIWSPFVRLNNASNLSGETGGSGLGLNVVRTLVEQHGGSAGIAESPDGGARFVVTFSTSDRTPIFPTGRRWWPASVARFASLRTRE